MAPSVWDGAAAATAVRPVTVPTTAAPPSTVASFRAFIGVPFLVAPNVRPVRARSDSANVGRRPSGELPYVPKVWLPMDEVLSRGSRAAAPRIPRHGRASRRLHP